MRMQPAIIVLACFSAVRLAATLPSHTQSAVAEDPDVVYCPDYLHYCEDGETCCYSYIYYTDICCPYAYATCCYKGASCCPPGTTCSSSGDKCYRAAPAGEGDTTELGAIAPSRHSARGGDNSSSPSVPSLTKTVPAQDGNVVCPDHQSQCTDDNTCCKLSNNEEWGCCPFKNAVCCVDGKHCCPESKTCDLTNNRCNDASRGIVVPFMLDDKRVV